MNVGRHSAPHSLKTWENAQTRQNSHPEHKTLRLSVSPGSYADEATQQTFGAEHNHLYPQAMGPTHDEQQDIWPHHV